MTWGNSSLEVVSVVSEPGVFTEVAEERRETAPPLSGCFQARDILVVTSQTLQKSKPVQRHKNGWRCSYCGKRCCLLSREIQAHVHVLFLCVYTLSIIRGRSSKFWVDQTVQGQICPSAIVSVTWKSVPTLCVDFQEIIVNNLIKQMN